MKTSVMTCLEPFVPAEASEIGRPITISTWYLVMSLWCRLLKGHLVGLDTEMMKAPEMMTATMLRFLQLGTRRVLRWAHETGWQVFFKQIRSDSYCRRFFIMEGVAHLHSVVSYSPIWFCNPDNKTSFGQYYLENYICCQCGWMRPCNEDLITVGVWRDENTLPCAWYTTLNILFWGWC